MMMVVMVMYNTVHYEAKQRGMNGVMVFAGD